MLSKTKVLQEIRVMRFEDIYEMRTERRLTMHEAAELLGVSERTFRRWSRRYESEGADGLYDQRLDRIAHNTAPVDEVMALLNLFETRYPNFNMSHFYDKYRYEHQGIRSYSWVKKRLQNAGLVKKSKKRGGHRKKRLRRPMPGMMLHQDGSTHEWVLKHKVPGSEIRCIKGKYYLYGYTTVWSKEKKRAQKKTTKQIGVITEEYGLIPTGMSRKGKVPKGESKIKDDIPVETNFLDAFEMIEDPRAQRNQLYTISEILLVTFLAVICGAEGWQDVENYGQSKINYLRSYLDYANGIPSDDTIRRFFRTIDPDHFKEIFSHWVDSLAKTVEAKVIAIDGKSHRRSFDGDDKMLHVVSAFATAARIVLGQEKVYEKSNEITAIPKLLDLLDVQGHIVTIDAMGCQYKIADKIINKKGDYIFSLKGNQGDLSDDVTLFLSDVKQKKKLISCIDYDKGHGRVETRECFVCHDVQWLRDRHDKWKTIQSIIRIDSKREMKSKTTQETRYYISSIKNITPEIALKSVREHWGIENTLHWILDMSFNEDYSRIRKGNAPQIMAIIRHVALNLLQRGKPKRQSIKGYRKVCAWNDDALTEIVTK